MESVTNVTRQTARHVLVSAYAIVAYDVGKAKDIVVLTYNFSVWPLYSLRL